MQITEEELINLWNIMCCHQSIRPTVVPIPNFGHYWLLIRSKWELADKNHPDTWMYSYEVPPSWFLTRNRWTL